MNMTATLTVPPQFAAAVHDMALRLGVSAEQVYQQAIAAYLGGNVPPENIMAMWETLQEYGVYSK